jgi:hypothetical protein
MAEEDVQLETLYRSMVCSTSEMLPLHPGAQGTMVQVFKEMTARIDSL